MSFCYITFGFISKEFILRHLLINIVKRRKDYGKSLMTENFNIIYYILLILIKALLFIAPCKWKLNFFK